MALPALACSRAGAGRGSPGARRCGAVVFLGFHALSSALHQAPPCCAAPACCPACCHAGLLAIALPVAVIGTNFASEWESYKRRRGGSGQTTSPHLDELTEALDAHVSTVTDVEDMLESVRGAAQEGGQALRSLMHGWMVNPVGLIWPGL